MLLIQILQESKKVFCAGYIFLRQAAGIAKPRLRHADLAGFFVHLRDKIRHRQFIHFCGVVAGRKHHAVEQFIGAENLSFHEPGRVAVLAQCLAPDHEQSGRRNALERDKRGDELAHRRDGKRVIFIFLKEDLAGFQIRGKERRGAHLRNRMRQYGFSEICERDIRGRRAAGDKNRHYRTGKPEKRLRIVGRQPYAADALS